MLFNDFINNDISGNCNFSGRQSLVPSLILLERDQRMYIISHQLLCYFENILFYDFVSNAIADNCNFSGRRESSPLINFV